MFLNKETHNKVVHYDRMNWEYEGIYSRIIYPQGLKNKYISVKIIAIDPIPKDYIFSPEGLDFSIDIENIIFHKDSFNQFIDSYIFDHYCTKGEETKII